MKPIKTLHIDQHAIQMYGDLINPLFDARQVLIDLLEYKQLNECWFYKQNKKNQDFVQIQACVVSPHGQQGAKGLDNQYSNTTIYLTEFGLYECLFASNKPIATQFRFQVMTLLKDIRLGNIKLSVQRECPTTELIEESKDSLISYITQLSDMQQQIDQLKDRLEQCSFIVYIYEQEIVATNEIYRGSSIAPKIRSNTHKYHSSCIKLKQAYETNQEVKVYIIGKAKVYNDNERRYFEQQYILNIPSNKKLNLKTPYPDSFANISKEHIEYTHISVQNIVRIPLADFIKTLEPVPVKLLGMTINYNQIDLELHQQYVEDNTKDVDFKQKIQDIKIFTSKHTFTPRDSELVDPVERSLGQLLVKIRNAYRTQSTNNYNLTAERYTYIKNHLPDLLQSDHQPFFNKILELKDFIHQHNRLPKQRGQNNNSAIESELYDWISHKRSYYKKHEFPQECQQFVNIHIPDFEFISLSDEQKFQNRIQQLKQFYQLNQRFPLQKENKVLQTYIKTIKSANYNQSGQTFKLTAERKQYINQELPEFIW